MAMRPPPVFGGLTARREDRQADDRLLTRLAATEPFTVLSAADLRWLARGAEVLDLPAGWVLFRQGDAARALYVLEAGRLAVEIAGPAGGRRITEIAAGEVVGEIGAVTGQPRSATVRALRDSTVIRLPKQRFFALVEREPSVAMAMLTATAHRLQSTVSPALRRRVAPRVVAIVPQRPDSGGPSIETCVRHIAAEMTRQGERIAVIGAEEAGRSVADLHHIECRHDRMILWADGPADGWTDRCERHADRILRVMAGHPGPLPSVPATADAPAGSASPLVPIDLVVWAPDPVARSWPLSPWADHIRAVTTHHVDPDDPDDVASLVRRMTGRSVGLVLSGGGARGFAHIGAFQALTEAGVPIDRVGGTSIGALIGAAIAMGWPSERVAEVFRRGFVDTNPLTDFTLPVRSLFRGRKARALLNAAFGTVTIEQTRRPYFAVAADLAHGVPVVLDRGPLVRALLASSAIPGLLPPIEIEGQILCDGAVIDTLPVATMRQRPAGGAVIAIDVNTTANERPPALDLTNHGIISILMRAGTLGSLAAARGARAAADLAVTPPVGGTDIQDWKAFPALVETGYRATIAAIEAGGVDRLFALSETADNG